MQRFFVCLILSVLISFGAVAKTIDQKKEELKKIYEAGGISKIEYEKSIEFLENPKEEKKSNTKKKFSIKSKTNDSKQLFIKKDKDKNKEEITLEKIEELGEIIKFDKSYYPEGMLKKFIGCGKGMKCVGQKAGSYMWGNFGKSPSWGQRYPGKMIKSMAMYEVFYASRLYSTRKAIKRFKEDDYKKALFSKKKENDEDTIRSLFGMNNGRKNMREALGMDMDTPAKEAIQKFWLLGEFLEMGVPTDNNITVNKDIKDRQEKLDVYKATISTLKKKLEERAEEKKSTKDKS
tara:strand:- start:17 stop:889 length:873 start_codon:yes stop_codon:yes gene_type:complete